MKNQKDCGWATFFSTLGWMFIVVGLVATVFIPFSGFNVSVMITVLSSIVTAFNFFFLSFLIQLIFECRNYLRDIADSKKENSY